MDAVEQPDGTYRPIIGDTVLYTMQDGHTRPGIILAITEDPTSEPPRLSIDAVIWVTPTDSHGGPLLTRISTVTCFGQQLTFGDTPLTPERLTQYHDPGDPTTGPLPLWWPGIAEAEEIEPPDADPRPEEPSGNPAT